MEQAGPKGTYKLCPLHHYHSQPNIQGLCIKPQKPSIYLPSTMKLRYISTITAIASLLIQDPQELIRDALSDLIQLNSRIADLSLFSPNETLEDISTRDLVYISIPYIRAEVQNRVRTTHRDERMSNLTQVQVSLGELADQDVANISFRAI
jgi:hypothetical protein